MGLVKMKLQLLPLHPIPKWGYVDYSGKFMVQPIFKNAHNFRDGFALVQLGGKFGFIDITGKFIINPQFNMAVDFYEGLALVISENKAYYIQSTSKCQKYGQQFFF